MKYVTVSKHTLTDTETRYPILSAGTSSEPQRQAKLGRIVIETDADPKSHEVLAGQIVPKRDDTLHAERTAEAWRALRSERDAYLKESDWTQVPDTPVDSAAWAEYRQALRDLPSTTDDPRNPTWPARPE